MIQKEFEYWQAVTGSSRYHWMEDPITSLNGRGALYYTGGESGVYIRITEAGHLTVGTYEGVVLHIREASFTKKAEHTFQDFNEGFQYACQLASDMKDAATITDILCHNDHLLSYFCDCDLIFYS